MAVDVEIQVATHGGGLHGCSSMVSLAKGGLFKVELISQELPFAGVPKRHTLRHVLLGCRWLLQEESNWSLNLLGFPDVGGHHPKKDKPPHQDIILLYLKSLLFREVLEAKLLSSPCPHWSWSILLWVVPEDRSRPAIGPCDEGLHLIIHHRAQQTAVCSRVHEEIVTLPTLDVDLQDVSWIPTLLLVCSGERESIGLPCIEMGNEAITLQLLALTSVHREILPGSNIHHQALFHLRWQLSENRVSFDQSFHPNLFFLKLLLFWIRLELFHLQLFDELQCKSSWNLRTPFLRFDR